MKALERFLRRAAQPAPMTYYVHLNVRVRVKGRQPTRKYVGELIELAATCLDSGPGRQGLYHLQGVDHHYVTRRGRVLTP